MTWILIIWMTNGGYSVPAIPVRVDEYVSKERCEQTGLEWVISSNKHPQSAYREFICLPK